MCDLFEIQMILSNKCNLCLQECKPTKFGSSVILCQQNIRLCMDCYFVVKNFDFLKQKYNLVKYLKKREIGLMNYKLH